MALITWQDNYALGISEIDNQHKKIVEIINRLFEMFSNKTANGTMDLGPTLKELTDYADYHFSTEEKYFELFQYEKAAPHIELHNNYRTKIEDFKKRYEIEKDETVFFELTNFLQDWWAWHINNLDREYVPVFQEHGVK